MRARGWGAGKGGRQHLLAAAIPPTQAPSPFALPRCTQARELLKRNWQQYARLWRSYTAARMAITVRGPGRGCRCSIKQAAGMCWANSGRHSTLQAPGSSHAGRGDR